MKIIREDSIGRKSINTINLNDANLLNSPYYYLRQNDVIYVEPNTVKAQESKVGVSTTLWFSGISILLSTLGILVTIFK